MQALYIGENKEDMALIKDVAKEESIDLDITMASTKEEAIEVLTYLSSLAIVIINCDNEKIKKNDPIAMANELLEFVGKRPVLFVGTGEELKEKVEEKVDLQKNNFYVCERPYSDTVLNETIKKILLGNPVEQSSTLVEINPDEYLPLRLGNFYLFRSIPYNVFMELTPKKYIQIIAKNQPYPESVIKNLVQRNVRTVYIEKNNYIVFLEESIKKALGLLSQKGLGSIKTIQVQVSSILLIHQYLRDIGVAQDVIDLTDRVISVTEENYKSFSSFQKILESFPFEQRDNSEKAILTIYLCEMLVQGLGWSSDMSRRQLGLASIVHDCFLKDDNMTNIAGLDTLEFKTLSPEQQEEFKNHPIKAEELTTQFLSFANVDFIVAEHHELPSGKGFPYGKNYSKLSSISSTFIVANNFVNQMAIKGISKSSIRNCMEYFEQFFNVGQFKESLNILRKNFNNI